MIGMKLKTPENIPHLVDCLSLSDENTYLLSGGTDLIIKLRKNSVYSGTIIDLSGISELKYINKDDDYIRIGSNTTFTEISNSETVKKYVSCLSEASRQIGSTQIRNTGTIGGNIANASPAGDSIPALMAVDARVVIINGAGKRRERAVEDIIEGMGKNKLKKDEAIVEVAVPIEKNTLSAFGKIGSRSTVTISKINMAAKVKYNDLTKEIEFSRVVLGALGPKAFYCEMVQEALKGKVPSKDLFEILLDTLTAQVDLAIQGRASQGYKREAIRGLACDVFYNLFKDIMIGGRS